MSIEIKFDDLMARFKAGDKNAFEAIYNEYHDNLNYFTKRLTGDEDQGEDITIATFMKLWNHRHNFENLTSIKAFLFITAKNACLSFLKNIKRESEKNEQYAYTLKQLEGIETRIGTQTELIMKLHEDVKDELRKQVDTLPEMARKVIIMTYFEGRSTQQIAEILQITESTVRGHRKSGISSLKNKEAIKKLINTILFILTIAAALGNFF